MSLIESPQSLTITRPDDWHLHLRDGDAMRSVLPDTARRFARAIVMPNLPTPVRTLADFERFAGHECTVKLRVAMRPSAVRKRIVTGRTVIGRQTGPYQ